MTQKKKIQKYLTTKQRVDTIVSMGIEVERHDVTMLFTN